jgi:hypothetical protein
MYQKTNHQVVLKFNGDITQGCYVSSNPHFLLGSLVPRITDFNFGFERF